MIEHENDKNDKARTQLIMKFREDGLELEDGMEEGAMKFFTQEDYKKQEEYDKLLESYSFLDFNALDKLNKLSSKN